jgi:hypothetical protein
MAAFPTIDLEPAGEPPSAELDRFDDLARTQAPRADADVLARRADEDVHALQVGALDALGLDVRVANSIGNLALLAANFTLRWHGFSGGGYH